MSELNGIGIGRVEELVFVDAAKRQIHLLKSDAAKIERELQRTTEEIDRIHVHRDKLEHTLEIKVRMVLQWEAIIEKLGGGK